MRTISLLLVAVLAHTAHAQPGASDPVTPAPAPAEAPYPPPPSPYPPPPPEPYPPAPVAPTYGPPTVYVPIQLTGEEQALLARGEISLGAHAGGVVANWVVGLGIGQAIQGRWSETGWIFTLGEIASFSALVYGVTRLDFTDEQGNSSNDNAGALIIGGLVGYLGFHIWSIVDAATGPASHNRKLRALKQRVGLPVQGARFIPYVKTSGDGGGTAGVTFRF